MVNYCLLFDDTHICEYLDCSIHKIDRNRIEVMSIFSKFTNSKPKEINNKEKNQENSNNLQNTTIINYS